MSLYYGLISSENEKVLCEVTFSSGPYASTIQKILTEKNPINTKVMYQISTFTVHVYNDGLLTYLLVSDEDYSKILAYTYLMDIKKAFSEKYGKISVKDTLPYGFQTGFGEIMKNQMMHYSQSKDNLAKLKGSLYETHQILTDNMEKILDRAQLVEILVQKSQENSTVASRLLCRSRIKKYQARCSALKTFSLFAFLLIIFATYFILSLTCGGPALPSLTSSETQ